MYNPMKNGRYYKFFIESDGSAYTLTTTDIEGASITSTYLMLPAGYKIVDVKYVVTSDVATAANMSHTLRFGANGEQGVVLPNKANMTDAEVYIYAIKD